MGLRDTLKRADDAVQDTRQSVVVAAVLGAAACVVAVIALVVAVVNR